MADDLHTIADLVADAFDVSDAEISELKQAAPLVAAMPTDESSNGTQHQYARETGAPVVGFRQPNAGRDFSKSTDEITTIALAILDFSWMVDKAVADAWRKGGRQAYVSREGFRHVKAALQKHEQQVLNGTVDGDATGFPGFADSANLNALSAEMVVDAGGTTADTGASAYFVRLGMNDVLGVYKGDSEIELGETVVQNYTPAGGGNLPGYYTPGCTWLGVQVGGLYSIGRIANLTEDNGAELTDGMGFEMYSRFPVDNRGRLVCVTNTRSVKQLQSSRTATTQTGVPAPWPTTIGPNIPILETDQLKTTEALLT